MESIKKLSNDYTGALSSDTMRPQDLLEKFSSFLDEVSEQTGIDAKMVQINAQIRELYRPDPESGDQVIDWDNEEVSDSASYTIQEMFDLLDEIAPPGHSFTSHEDDGACYGFWRFTNHLEEIPCPIFSVVSSEEVKDEFEVSFKPAFRGSCIYCGLPLTSDQGGWEDDFEVCIHINCIDLRDYRESIWTVVYVHNGLVDTVIPCQSEEIAQREYHRLVIEHGDCLETDLQRHPGIRQELLEAYADSKEIDGKHYLVHIDHHIMMGNYPYRVVE